MAGWGRSSLHAHAGEIIETTSPAKAYLIAAHTATGRHDLAAFIAALPSDLFAAWDQAMMAAFIMGQAEAERARDT